MRRVVTVLSSVLSLAVVTTAAAPQQPIFRGNTTLVVQTVTVTDAAGRPIEGLTAADFTILEDGTPQTLSFVEFQRLRDDVAAPEPTARLVVPASDVAPITATGIASSRVGDARYRDHRLLVFYFDLPGMPGSDRLRALWSADTFITSGMGASDLVAVITFEGDAVRVKQDFTDNREQLREVIRTLIEGNDRDGDGVPDEPVDEATEFGQNGGELNFLRTDRQLSALQTAVSMLRPLPEQKTLLYFVSGLTLSGLDNQAQLSATVNAAIRSNVSINPIDARGLVAEAPLGGANVASPSGIGAFTGVPAQTRRDRFERSQDTLFSMAKDTGGAALFNYNDLARGIRQAAAAVKSYYILGYYTNRPDKDGRFRRVRVSVAGHPSARLTYRQGYFAEKEFSKFNAADKERQLEDALMLGDPITEIPMALEVNYFQLNRSEYFVPVSVKIPGSELTFDRDRPNSRTEIDLIGEVKDERGIAVQNVRDKLEIPLTADRAAELTARPIQYETGFTLLPGRYTIKLLARDATSGHIGTYQNTFVVPNLNRETATVRMSSVVLSSQRVASTDTLFRVRQKIPTDGVNPLVANGTRLLPSVTRVFSASRDLNVLFHTYRMENAANGPLVASVSLYRGGMKVFDSDPIEADVKTALVPFQVRVPLVGLAPGTYECQVSVLDLGLQKARFWRASIVIVP